MLTMNTTIDVICYKYKPLKNNEFPLKIRITKNRVRKYVNLGISVKYNQWDFNKNRPTNLCPNKEYIEKIIAENILKYKNRLILLKAYNKDFSAVSLVMGDEVHIENKSVGEVFKYYISQLQEQGRHGYEASVVQVYNSLKKFNKSLNISFSEVDISWLKKYESWLRKQGLNENTIGIRFRTLRVIYNIAIDEFGFKPDIYPFNKFKVSRLHESTTKRALSKEQILKIISCSFDNGEIYKSLAIDLFTFSYLMAGINFVDMAYLTDENIIDNNLCYYRRKTSKFIEIPIHPKAKEVLLKYASTKDKYLFPILSSNHLSDKQQQNRIHKVITKVNFSLKLIGAELKIPTSLTTYVARHSFATVLKRSGVSTAIISESLGHSSEKVTQIYLDSFENGQITNALKKLL